MPRACVAVCDCRCTRTLQGSGSMLSACGAAPACQPVRALQAGEESIAKLLTTIPTQPGGKRRGFMARYGSGLVLTQRAVLGQFPDHADGIDVGLLIGRAAELVIKRFRLVFLTLVVVIDEAHVERTGLRLLDGHGEVRH